MLDAVTVLFGLVRQGRSIPVPLPLWTTPVKSAWGKRKSASPSLSKSIPSAISQASFKPSPSESGQPDEHAGTGPRQVAPIPVSGTVCGELFFAAIFRLALRVPFFHGGAGVNARLISTLSPGATVTGKAKP